MFSYKVLPPMQATSSFWSTYVDLGTDAQRLGHTRLAETMLGAAMDESRRLGHLQLPPPAVFNKLASSFYAQNNPKKAESIYKTAIHTYERRLTEDHPHLHNILINLAELYFSQGKFAHAEPLFERAIRIDEKNCSSISPAMHRRILKLSWIYCALGKETEAYALLKKIDVGDSSVTVAENAPALQLAN